MDASGPSLLDHIGLSGAGSMTTLPSQLSAVIAPTPSRDRLERMELAASRIVDCMSSLHRAGKNIVTAALHGSAEFLEWEHYPIGDVCDPDSGAQYYFHAHSPDDRADPDFGHFHCFLGLPEIGPSFDHPRVIDNSKNSQGLKHSLCHIVAISMTADGFPNRLFTTNRWVTGEQWRDARSVISSLDRFSFEFDHPSRILNSWLTEMIILFRPQIEDLQAERDRAIARWQAENPDMDIFENRHLEVTSSVTISLYDHIEWLERSLSTSR